MLDKNHCNLMVLNADLVQTHFASSNVLKKIGHLSFILSGFLPDQILLSLPF